MGRFDRSENSNEPSRTEGLAGVLDSAAEEFRVSVERQVSEVVAAAERRAAEIEQRATESATAIEQRANERAAEIEGEARARADALLEHRLRALARVLASVDVLESGVQTLVAELREELAQLDEPRSEAAPSGAHQPAESPATPETTEIPEAVVISEESETPEAAEAAEIPEVPEAAELQDPAPLPPERLEPEPAAAPEPATVRRELPPADENGAELSYPMPIKLATATESPEAYAELAEMVRQQVNVMLREGRPRAEAERLVTRLKLGQSYIGIVDEIYSQDGDHDEAGSRRRGLRRRGKR